LGSAFIALVKPVSAADQSSARKRSVACLAGPLLKNGSIHSGSNLAGFGA